MNKFRTILSVIIILCLSLYVVASTKSRTLRDIYKSGKIIFKPTLTISLDSFPDDIYAKTLIFLMPWQDKLYISDVGIHDIKICGQDGRFYKKFSLKGTGPGDTLLPSSLCISNGRLLVWEIGNKRVSSFSPDGKFLTIYKPDLVENGKRLVYDMKALDDGRIVFESIAAGYDNKNRAAFEWHILDLYSSELKFIKEIYRQAENSCDYSGGRRKEILVPFTPGLLWSILNGNKIVLCFPEKYEIKIMDLNTGQTKVFSQPYTPVKISAADKKIYFDYDPFAGRGQSDPERDKYFRENTPFPEYKPAIKRICCDNEGHILVFPYLPSDNGKYYNMYADAFDVFDNQGNKINHVTVQNKEGFYTDIVCWGKNNEFWVRRYDDNMDIEYVKYIAQ